MEVNCQRLAVEPLLYAHGVDVVISGRLPAAMSALQCHAKAAWLVCHGMEHLPPDLHS